MVQRFLDNTKLPSHYQEDFLGLLHSPDASESSITQSDSCTLSNMSTIIPVTHANWSDLSNIILPSSYKVRSLESDEQLSLWTVYKSLYTEQVIERNSLAETVKTYSSVTLGNLFYGSKSDCRSLRSARIYASWAMADQDKINLERFYLLAGHVLFYLSHSIKLNGKYVKHVFASVMWYRPDDHPDQFGNPTKTFKLNEFLAYGPSSFLPVQRIYCRAAAAETLVGGEKKIVTVPLDRYQVLA